MPGRLAGKVRVNSVSPGLDESSSVTGVDLVVDGGMKAW